MEKMTIKSPEAAADGKDNNEALQLPPGSYLLEDLHAAAEGSVDDRLEAIEKANQTGTDRLAPGLTAGTKRVEVTDEVKGITEHRVVPKTAVERGKEEATSAQVTPTSQPETTSQTTGPNTGSKSDSKAGDISSTSTTASTSGKAGSGETE